jgi:hypothetical protein
MPWHRAGIEVVGFRATETALVIAATVKMPIGMKKRARWSVAETSLDI